MSMLAQRVGTLLAASATTLVFLAVNVPTAATAATECAPLTVPVRVALQGAYDSSSGSMRDTLRTTGVLPSTEPYSVSGYVMRGGEGAAIDTSVLATTGPTSIVDWVLVELRDPVDPALLLATDAVPIGRDGVAAQPPRFKVKPGAYVVAVEHRNHLGVATTAPVQVGTTTAAVDFTDPALSTTGAPRVVEGNTALLQAGEANAAAGSAGNVRYNGPGNDRDALLAFLDGNEIGYVTGYHREDLNLDGVVRYNGPRNDRDFLLSVLGGNEIGFIPGTLPVARLAPATDLRYSCDVPVTPTTPATRTATPVATRSATTPAAEPSTPTLAETGAGVPLGWSATGAAVLVAGVGTVMATRRRATDARQQP